MDLSDKQFSKLTAALKVAFTGGKGKGKGKQEPTTGGPRRRSGGNGQQAEDGKFAAQVKKLQNQLKQAQDQTAKAVQDAKAARQKVGGSSAKQEEAGAATEWSCDTCGTSHDNMDKWTCRKRNCRATRAKPPAAKAASEPEEVKGSSGDRQAAEATAHAGPAGKPRMHQLFLRHGMAGDERATEDDEGASDAGKGAGKSPNEAKRCELEKQIKALQGAGCGEDLVKALQADLDKLPKEKITRPLRDLGMLNNCLAEHQEYYQKLETADADEVSKAQTALEDAQQALQAAVDKQEAHKKESAATIQVIQGTIAAATKQAQELVPNLVPLPPATAGAEAAAQGKPVALDANLDIMFQEFQAFTASAERPMPSHLSDFLKQLKLLAEIGHAQNQINELATSGAEGQADPAAPAMRD